MSGYFTHLVARTLAAAPMLAARLPHAFEGRADPAEPPFELDSEVPAPAPSGAAPIERPAQPAPPVPVFSVRPPAIAEAAPGSRPDDSPPAPARKRPEPPTEARRGPPPADPVPAPSPPPAPSSCALPPAPAAARPPVERQAPAHPLGEPKVATAASGPPAPMGPRLPDSAPVLEAPPRVQRASGELVPPRSASHSAPNPVRAKPAAPDRRAGEAPRLEDRAPVQPQAGGAGPGVLTSPMVWPGDDREPAPPDVVISIGLVEVRAAAPVRPAPPPQRIPPRPRPLSLNDYLAKRGRSER